MFNWNKALGITKYKFDAIGVSSIDSYIDDEYGKLRFHWEGDKKNIRIQFINRSVNCICVEPTILKCNCCWIAFKESDPYPSKVFTKQEVEKMNQLTLSL